MAAKKGINVAVVGLGRVGSKFIGALAAKGGNIKILAAAEKDSSAQGVSVAKKLGITVVNDVKDIVTLGESVDVIFDLSGSAEARKNLRSDMARSGNQHTVIAPEIVAFLLWDLMGEKGELPEVRAKKGY